MKVILHGRGDFDEWRDAARDLLRHGVPPGEVDWGGGTGCLGGLFDDQTAQRLPLDRPVTVPAAFVDLAEAVICHSESGRFALAYRLLWRLQTERGLLGMATDPDVVRARRLAHAVHRDSHKITAFVRFREVPSRGGRRAFAAWFEPDHYIVARMAPFFQRRFNDMDWAILTPKGTASWDGCALRFCPEPADKPGFGDDTEDLWRVYFANIFNPARLKVKMMLSEMPRRYWKNLPEAETIPGLVHSAEARLREMAAQSPGPPPKFHARLQR
ncbi:MAG: TIGR03915 family putative DNA repair protein [Asticcacaulis sp.]